MATYRAAYLDDTVLTSVDQRDLPEADLIEAAVAEAHHAKIVGTEYPYVTEEHLRSQLVVGTWTEPGTSGQDDEDEVPAPEAAGYAIVQEGYALFGVGSTEAEAWVDAREWVGRDEDGEPSFGGLVCEQASQALIDSVRVDGTPSNWGEVDGVLCTSAEEAAYAA